MKKQILIFIIGLLMIPTVALAAGTASGSVPAQTTTGSNVTFTVTLSNTAAWNVALNGTGATSNCSTKYADVTADGRNTNKSLTLTCKATTEGTITFTATGDITSADGANSNISVNKTVTVVKPREKETEARLTSLQIKNYNINFNKDTYDYSIVIEPTVNNIEISAKAISSYANVSGVGTKKITDDYMSFPIIVTAENGAQKTYKINVTVKDNNPITIDVNKKTYNVLKNNKNVNVPEKFEQGTISINDTEVPSYTNAEINMTLVGIIDEQGTIKFAVYKDGKYELFNENKSEYLNLYIVEGNLDKYEKTKVNINEQEYSAFKYNDRFSIVYAMNLSTGEYNYYKYDTKEKTFQLFEIEKKDTCKSTNSKEEKNNKKYIFTIVILSIIIIGLTSYIVIEKRK